MIGERAGHAEICHDSKLATQQELARQAIEIVAQHAPEPVLGVELEMQIRSADGTAEQAIEHAVCTRQLVRDGQGGRIVYRLPSSPVEAGHITTQREVFVMKRMDPCAFLLSTDAVSGHVSGMAVTWMNRCDKKSWMVSVKQTSYTMQLIRSSREFVLALASASLVDELTYFGSTKGHTSGIDKLTDTSLITESFVDSRIRTPQIVGAYRNIACQVGGILPVSDEYAIVYGNIVEQHDNQAAEQLFYCGKNSDGTRRYAVQHGSDVQFHIDELLPKIQRFHGALL